MTKIIQQLQFSSSNYDVLASSLDSISPKEKSYYGDGASLSAGGSKRSALSASDAECFSLCLGAGPLCLGVLKWVGSEIPSRKLLDAQILISSKDTNVFGLSSGPDAPARSSAPPGGVTGGAASPATPSTPTYDDNRDLLSALLWNSVSSLASSSESLSSEPAPPNQHNVIVKILDKKDRQPVKIDFKIFLTENTITRWEAVVQNNTMYLRVPAILQSGSKESFMLLLDFAEEQLGVNNCIICILKTRPDRATLLRTFMFLGFQLLAPTSPLMPEGIDNPDYIFLHYNMQ